MDFVFFALFTIMNNGAVNICVQVSVWTYVLTSLGCIPWSGISRSYGSSMSDILRNYQFLFKEAAHITIFTFKSPLRNTQETSVPRQRGSGGLGSKKVP